MNVERLLGSLLSGGISGGSRRRSGASSMLSGLGVGKAQVGVGLLGVAFAAFEHYQQNQAQTAAAAAALPLAAGSPPPPPPAPGNPQMSPPPPPLSAIPAPAQLAQRDLDLMLVLEVMIAAAHADGRLDSDERSTILERAMQLDLSKDDRQQLFAAMEKPPSLAQIGARARPEIATDLYVAAVLAITIDTESERQWLASLAHELSLDSVACRQIEANLGG